MYKLIQLLGSSSVNGTLAERIELARGQIPAVTFAAGTNANRGDGMFRYGFPVDI